MLVLTSLLLLHHSLAAVQRQPRSSSALVTISNIEPRLSTDGEIVNAHDGTVRWVNGKWFMHAAQYGGPVHRAVPVTHYPVKAMMRGEVKVRVVKRHLRHAAFR